MPCPHRCAPSRWAILPILLAAILTHVASASSDESSNWAVTTLAGQATVGGIEDGVGERAHFEEPRGIVTDSTGQMFVADTAAHTIRKISPSGAVTTFAGTPGVSGSADGVGAKASFNSPAGLAMDRNNTLYVSDMLNHVIRKITPDGTVSTFAGSAGKPGSADGKGSAAQFQEPIGIAVDASGNVYVADAGNSVVRKITSQGEVSTLAGAARESGHDDGAGPTARFDAPYGLAIDSYGNVYVADTFNHTVRKVTPTGDVTTLAGTAGQSGTADGLSVSARFSGPSALAIDSAGNIYVTETANHQVRIISTSGLVASVAGASGNDGSSDGVGTNSRFNAPHGVAVGPAGNLLVSDTVNHTIRKLTRVQATTPSLALGAGRMFNISTRSFVGDGDKVMIAGFIIAGSEPKQVLIRASGPALAQYGLASTLDDPMLVLYAGHTQIAENDDWATDADRIESTAKRANAFPWSRGSKDAALLITLPPGGYTVHVISKNGTHGTALIEAYEADEIATTGKFVNISTRAEVRTAGDIMIAGFIISGTAPKRVLIRASGPALSDFLPNGTLVDPVLAVHAGDKQIALNDDWGTDDQTGIEAAAAQTGAFLWKRGSKDAALLVTLDPGAYTALVHGKNDGVGIGLIEVYEVP